MSTKIAVASPSSKTYPIGVDGEQCIEPHFSWSPCDYQGSNQCNLGGDRYDIEYRETLRGKLNEMTVCSDCYYLIMTGSRTDDYETLPNQ